MSAAIEKKRAALGAVAYVESGMMLGLGTGSTAYYAIEAIGERWQNGSLTDIRAVATSEATIAQATQYGIPLMEINEVDTIDLTIDGADEFDGQLRLIKGGGGAFREKLVAYASRQMIVITDASKRVDTLGAFPLPVEVIPRALQLVKKELINKGLQPVLRKAKDGQPYLTDNGNVILDCHVGAISNPEELDVALHLIRGVGNGSFLRAL
ncbi:MAG: ribose-5-phosphate isomerase RpiA [Saprospiraceae bacterium]